MTGLKNFFNLKKESNKNPLIGYFANLESSGVSPFEQALTTYESLHKNAKSEKEFYEHILEDIIFSSLYATFYEHILTTIGANESVALELIENFSNDGAERERVIAKQTQDHLNFIFSNGICPGCSSCENHGDVAELIYYWQKADFDFFINLYIGMQTIQFGMEHLLYDVLPSNKTFYKHLSSENILDLRQFVFTQSENSLKA